MDLSYAAGDLPGLMRQLRAQARGARLLLLSVHDGPTVVAAAVAAGADGLVVKRAIGRDLMPAVDALLVGQRYFDSSAAP
jgi:DNA-binding NarL/FixJ family response regulator